MLFRDILMVAAQPSGSIPLAVEYLVVGGGGGAGFSRGGGGGSGGFLTGTGYAVAAGSPITSTILPLS